jgi:5-methylcytosine-specific restriction endonuclease McrA
MKTLTPIPPVPTYLDRFIAIRDKKRNPTRASLIAAHALLTNRYQEYERAIAQNALAGLPQCPAARQLSNDFRACYSGSTQPLRDLKKAIVDAQPPRQLKYCPMCGMALPNTYDHYLPAVLFPEYAVHPQNLVPCCSSCNSIKGDKWLCAAGERQYLNAYSDELPDVQILQVTLHQDPALRGVGATFSLRRPSCFTEAQWRLIDSHFRRLCLIDRYDELGNQEISEILSMSKIFLDEGAPDVRAILSSMAKERQGVHGRNHWTAVLMLALAVHKDLESWIDPA